MDGIKNRLVIEREVKMDVKLLDRDFIVEMGIVKVKLNFGDNFKYLWCNI